MKIEALTPFNTFITKILETKSGGMGAAVMLDYGRPAVPGTLSTNVAVTMPGVFTSPDFIKGVRASKFKKAPESR